MEIDPEYPEIPHLTAEDRRKLDGKQICYCPKCGWYVHGAARSCPECDYNRLRVWLVE